MKPKVVLVIDDEDGVRQVVAATLMLIGGWDVITAHGGRAGLILAETEQPDGILLDVDMPGFSGPETLALLKANPATAHIPVAFLTASGRTAELLQLQSKGLCGLLHKPFDPDKLVQLVAKAFQWN